MRGGHAEYRMNIMALASQNYLRINSIVIRYLLTDEDTQQAGGGSWPLVTANIANLTGSRFTWVTSLGAQL